MAALQRESHGLAREPRIIIQSTACIPCSIQHLHCSCLYPHEWLKLSSSAQDARPACSPRESKPAQHTLTVPMISSICSVLRKPGFLRTHTSRKSTPNRLRDSSMVLCSAAVDPSKLNLPSTKAGPNFEAMTTLSLGTSLIALPAWFHAGFGQPAATLVGAVLSDLQRMLGNAAVSAKSIALRMIWR